MHCAVVCYMYRVVACAVLPEEGPSVLASLSLQEVQTPSSLETGDGKA